MRCSLLLYNRSVHIFNNQKNMSNITMRWAFNALWKGISYRSCLQFLALYALVCLTEGRPRTLKRCGRRDSEIGKIVGGKDAQPGEYPWQVSVQYRYGLIYKHFCGGAILNEHYIVTAAHCIYPETDPQNITIYTGLSQLSKKYRKPAKRYKISEMITHEDYENENGRNDIALLRTELPIQFEGTSGYVNGICLPQNDDYPTGWAIATGWGDMKEDAGELSDVLKAVKVPLVPWSKCFEAYKSTNDTVQETNVCAGIVNRDSCQSDSGGPLVQKDKRGIYTLIGVVSWGEGCARREYPGVYTRVASYMDWLEENMD